MHRPQDFCVYKLQSALQVKLLSGSYKCKTCGEKNYKDAVHPPLKNNKPCKAKELMDKHNNYSDSNYVNPRDYMRPKEGGILLEIAKSIGRQQYDWKNTKITFQLKGHEIGSMIAAIENRQNLKFIHKSLDNSMKMFLCQATTYVDKDDDTNTQKNGLSIMIKVKGGDSISIQLSEGEVVVFKELLKASIPIALWWM